MPNLKSILRSLHESNYLTGKCVLQNEKLSLELSLLGNGLKLREQLLKQWFTMSIPWATPYGKIKENNEMPNLQSKRFKDTYNHIYEENLVNLSTSIALKTICSNDVSNLVDEHHLLYGSKSKTLLITDLYVDAKDELSKYHNLQRERKIWWMRLSADPSRYYFKPSDQHLKEEIVDEVCKKSKLTNIKANFPFGLADIEFISLVPLYKMGSLNLQFTENYKISLIRSVINLDLATLALILDASECSGESRNNTLMLNRKFAPYQIVLANLHQENKSVNELTLHLQHVISRCNLRLYDNFVHTNTQSEFEKKLMQFDSLGIPYTLLVNDESSRSGLIKMRSRDTTLFETIHISDIPNYLSIIFK